MFKGILAIGLLSALAAAPSAYAQSVDFIAELKASNEVPPNASPATGSVTVNLEEESRIITFNVSYSGLTGTATAAHFHGPAAPGANAGAIVPIPAAKLATPKFNGAATLSEQQVHDLLDGKLYFNIHTAANPGGEIRGQVLKMK